MKISKLIDFRKTVVFIHQTKLTKLDKNHKLWKNPHIRGPGP